MKIIIKIYLMLVLFLFAFQVQAHDEHYTLEEVEFFSHGNTLAGTIVLPKDGVVHSAVVFVHGSGKQTRNLYWGQRFASAGIAALVYDKRGVGLSGGHYEAKQSVSEYNINLLAEDALAALDVLHRQSRFKNIPLGLAGISQAGWIIPLAAEKSSRVDFMAIWSGPVCKVSEEDIYSKFTADLDNEDVPSYEKALNSRVEEYIWPKFLGEDSDPNTSLSELKIPGIWIFGSKDGSIPVDLSIDRLESQIQAGGRYEYVNFSSLGHNNMSETFTTVTAWIKRIKK